jgi:hypothetical protein
MRNRIATARPIEDDGTRAFAAGFIRGHRGHRGADDGQNRFPVLVPVPAPGYDGEGADADRSPEEFGRGGPTRGRPKEFLPEAMRERLRSRRNVAFPADPGMRSSG